jgi:hypothetical protein
MVESETLYLHVLSVGMRVGAWWALAAPSLLFAKQDTGCTWRSASCNANGGLGTPQMHTKCILLCKWGAWHTKGTPRAHQAHTEGTPRAHRGHPVMQMGGVVQISVHQVHLVMQMGGLCKRPPSASCYANGGLGTPGHTKCTPSLVHTKCILLCKWGT